ncbi:MAG: conjugal transfer protein TraG N-terminal domain-containing protein [Gammaproteobacteria bacterium]
MSIGVQSFPELYTMLMGWNLYDKMWNLLTQTGIAYLPFIGIILRNVTQSYLAHRDTGQISLRRMEVDLITTLLLILFAASPCVPLSAHALSYSPVCGAEQGKTYYTGDTGTTYDKAFSIPTNDVTVPIWWYVVISVSEGMTNAANTMVGCVPNLRKMVTQVDMTKISDPEVKQELQDFETMCYVPARIQFNQDKQTKNITHLDHIDNNVKEYGVEDTEWVGSHGFTDVYYQNLRATRPIPGFSYDASQDINADSNQKNPPAYGTPSCSEWWNDSQYGLKNRLYQVLPKSFFDEFKNYLNDAKTHDDVVKRIISNNANGFDNANATIGDNGYSHIVSALGIWFHQMEEYPKLYAASQAAPIMQALLLLMIYVFLPFTLIFSNYRASSFVTGAMLIFSVIFWGFIWHLVSWTDNALMQALYSDWFVKQGAGATLADMIIASLVIFSPIFWFIFMGAMGIAVGDIASSLSMGINKIGENAANKGANQVKAAVSEAGKALLI